MPEFIRPKRAIIETGGGDWLGVVLFVLAAAAVLAVIGAAAAFVIAHAVLIGTCCAVFLAVIGGLAVAWRIRYREREPLPLPRGWSANAGRQLGSQRAALDAPPLAIAPVIHQHVHFHGVSAEDVAVITSRESQPWPPSSSSPS